MDLLKRQTELEKLLKNTLGQADALAQLGGSVQTCVQHACLDILAVCLTTLLQVHTSRALSV
jgi:hypothetical protein